MVTTDLRAGSTKLQTSWPEPGNRETFNLHPRGRMLQDFTSWSQLADTLSCQYTYNAIVHAHEPPQLRTTDMNSSTKSTQGTQVQTVQHKRCCNNHDICASRPPRCFSTKEEEMIAVADFHFKHTFAVSKPSAMSIFSMISCRSGTTTVIGLKSALSDSGSSARPM